MQLVQRRHQLVVAQQPQLWRLSQGLLDVLRGRLRLAQVQLDQLQVAAAGLQLDVGYLLVRRAQRPATRCPRSLCMSGVRPSAVE